MRCSEESTPIIRLTNCVPYFIKPRKTTRFIGKENCTRRSRLVVVVKVWAVVRRFEEVWGGVRRCEEVWGGVRRCEEVWGGVRRCEEVWGGVRRCEEVWGGDTVVCKSNVVAWEEHIHKHRKNEILMSLSSIMWLIVVMTLPKDSIGIWTISTTRC